MYALAQKFDGKTFAIVGEDGRFEFPATDGPMLADMLDSEWPECAACGDRDCPFCETCVSEGCNCQCPPECEGCQMPEDDCVCDLSDGDTTVEGLMDDIERIVIDQSDGSDFADAQQVAVLAADMWALDNPPVRTQAEYTRGLISEGLLHLLELGVVHIDGDRLRHLMSTGCPVQRRG